MRRKMTCVVALCVCLSICLSLLPALALSGGAEEDRTVSPWAEEELHRAESLGLLDVGALRADYAAGTEPVTDWTRSPGPSSCASP